MTSYHDTLAFIGNIGGWEWIAIALVALLIFGRRLPEVGRSLGKSFVEFKKGLKDTGDELKEIKSEADDAVSDAHLEASDNTKSKQPQNTGAKSKSAE